MTEPVYDYYATRIVQDLEDDLYDSKERIQRLRRQNDELTAENERLREGVKRLREELADLHHAGIVYRNGWTNAVVSAHVVVTHLDDLLEGDTE